MKRNFGQRIHDYLQEPEGEQFVAGKWRFWLVAVVGLSVLNAILTALIFKNDDQENYISPIMLSVGALLAWLCVGCLHYSDSTDRRLARGVAGLDSITLLFVVAHFAGLMWAYGHLKTIQSAERKYEAATAVYNAKAEKVAADNVKIAEAAKGVADAEAKRARIENDTAYQTRKAAEAGVKITPRGSRESAAAALATSPVELERPARPEETSSHFLGEWDWLIRVMNFGELMLAAITLVFIRNQSAKTNSPVENLSPAGDIFSTRAYRSPLSTPAFDSRTANSDRDTTVVHFGDTFDRKAARKKLLDHLKAISFHNPGKWFKADLVEGGIHIRMSARVNGIEETIAETRQSDKLLMAVDRPDFRARLVEELRHQGFEI